jgi:D-alanyl-D-alanine carboxypeptidase
MNSKILVKLALSTAVVGFTALGGASVGASSASTQTSTKATAQAKKAHGWAMKAEKLFAKGKVDKALALAEAAVQVDMQNMEYRSLLARIYMSQGRFASAERTFMDVMELGQVDPRTVVSVALMRIGQGKTESALSLVEAHRSILPASDYGLALALAGEQKQAVQILTDAIRADNASARTRQNLALAYALDGRWREARIMAVQDMPQDRVDERIVEWAQYARPGAYQVRVAGLLKVTPQADSGQPVHLALNGVTAQPQMAAAEEPETVSMAAAAPVEELAPIGPAPAAMDEIQEVVKMAMAAVPEPAVEAPLIKAPEGPAKAATAAPAPQPVKAAAAAPKPVKLALADTAPVAKMGGSHVLQLGAFSSAAGAQKAWSQLTAKHKVLQGFSSATSTVTVNGKTLTRVAATGFGNFQAANAACNQIKASGGVCMIRSLNGAASPVRMAARPAKTVAKKPVRIASR